MQRVKANNHQATSEKVMTLIREGERARQNTSRSTLPSTLQRETNWELQVDLKKKLVFPSEVAVTSLHLDMIFLSQSTKSIVVSDLTVPWEEGLAVAHELKKSKYQDLIDEALTRGWNATVFPIEVGCGGFPSSVQLFLQRIGLEPRQMNNALREIASPAEESSRWLWLTKDRSWNPSASEA